MKDPVFICNAFKKNRFYIYSRREPETEKLSGGKEVLSSRRDVQNEKVII